MHRSRLVCGGCSLLAVLLCAVARVQADPPRPFAHLTVEQGLSQSNVTCLLQDDRGVLWVGTQDGLNRFDGQHFTVFQAEPRNPASISDNSITRVLEDRAGRIWIGTQNGGLNRYDPGTGRFIRYGSGAATGQDLGSTGILSIAADRDGTLWLGTWGGGLTRFDPASGTASRYRHQAGNQTSLSNDNVWAVAIDHEGVVWAGTFGGLNRLDRRTGRFTSPSTGAPAWAGVAGANVSALLEDHAGVLWIGTWGRGLVACDGARTSCRTFRAVSTNPSALSDDRVWSLAEDERHHLWVGTERGGLDEFDGQRFIRHLQPNQGDLGLPVAPGVNAVLADRTGIVWAGTSGAGLYKILPPLQPFERLRPAGLPGGVAPDANVWAVLEDHSGVVWVGTLGTGLVRVDPLSGRFARIPLNPRRPASRPEGVYAITESPSGDIIVGSDGEGLLRVDRRTDTLEPFPAAAALRAALTSVRVMSLWADADGTLWVGTLGHGLFRVDGTTGEVTHFAADPRTAGALASNSILAIRRTRDGLLWLGTFGDGLERLSGGRFTHYRADPGNPNTVGDDRIVALQEDHEGALWIGTSGGGLTRLSADRRTFTSLTKNDGLPDDTVYGVLEDETGAIWASTNRGICRIVPSTRTIRTFTTTDGVLDTEFNQGAYHGGRSGYLYFGGLKGVTRFRPAAIQDARPAPPLIIASFSRGTDPPFDGAQLPRDGVISLRHDESSFSIEAAALDYVAPERVVYQFRLDGRDAGWSPATRRAYVSYSRVPAGRYTFRVRAWNGDGAWHSPGVSLTIVVAPAPWATWWAFALYGATVAAVGVAAGWLRVRSRRRKQAAQEAELSREREVSATLRHAEQALRVSEERFRKFMDNFPGIAFLKDADFRAVFVNRAFEQTFGVSNAQVTGKHDEEYFPASAAAGFREADLRVAREQRTLDYVDVVPCPDGTRFYQTTKFPILEDGRVAFIGGVAVDITDKKQLEQQLLQAQKLESIGTLAGGIAHDFNNLLTIITGYTTLLRTGQLDDAEATRSMAAIEQAVERGAGLVRQNPHFRPQGRRVVQAGRPQRSRAGARRHAARDPPEGHRRRALPERQPAAHPGGSDPGPPGPAEPLRQCARRHAQRRDADAHDQRGGSRRAATSLSGGARLPVHPRGGVRHRGGHGRVREEPGVRAVLHHERPRPRHGLGAGRCLRRDAGTRRVRAARERTGSGYDLHALLPRAH